MTIFIFAACYIVLLNIQRDIIEKDWKLGFLENIFDFHCLELDTIHKVKISISSKSHSRFIQINLLNFQMSRINLSVEFPIRKIFFECCGTEQRQIFLLIAIIQNKLFMDIRQSEEIFNPKFLLCKFANLVFHFESSEKVVETIPVYSLRDILRMFFSKDC